MQTVSFQCGHCHKVMGVTSAYLGKQVRCPHCQEVVMAPDQAPAPPPEFPTPAPPSVASSELSFAGPSGRDENESIFVEQVPEDLFDVVSKPKIELPPEPVRPDLQLEPTVFQVPGPAQSPAPPPVMDFSSSAAAPSMAPTISAVGPPPNEWAAAAAPTPGTDGASEMLPVARVPTRPGDSSNLVFLYYLIGLISLYAIVMTIVALYFHNQADKAPHPMEILPDEGDPKASRVTSQLSTRLAPTTELPPQLITALGKPLTIGDLEVTPTQVERKFIQWKFRRGTPGATDDRESLVLDLTLKNISKDTAFRPTDCRFDYKWKESEDPKKKNLPYTYLYADGHYYCGPYALTGKLYDPRSDRGLRDEYVEGQKDDDKVLKPGQEVKTVLATSPDDEAPVKLRDYKDKMLWRVQLRRGLVHYNSKDISCTAVVGIEFDMSQVEKN